MASVSLSLGDVVREPLVVTRRRSGRVRSSMDSVSVRIRWWSDRPVGDPKPMVLTGPTCTSRPAVSSARDRPGASSARRARRAGGAARRARGPRGRRGRRRRASAGTTYQLPSSISSSSCSAPHPAYPAKIRIPRGCRRRAPPACRGRPARAAPYDRSRKPTGTSSGRRSTATASAPSVLTGPPWKSTSGSATTSPQRLEDLGDRDGRGPVEDHAERAVLVDVEQQHDRVGEVGVEQHGRGHQQHPRSRLRHAPSMPRRVDTLAASYRPASRHSTRGIDQREPTVVRRRRQPRRRREGGAVGEPRGEGASASGAVCPRAARSRGLRRRWPP